MALNIRNPFLQSFRGRKVGFLPGGECRLTPLFKLMAPALSHICEANQDAFGKVMLTADLGGALLATGNLLTNRNFELATMDSSGHGSAPCHHCKAANGFQPELP